VLLCRISAACFRRFCLGSSVSSAAAAVWCPLASTAVESSWPTSSLCFGGRGGWTRTEFLFYLLPTGTIWYIAHSHVFGSRSRRPTGLGLISYWFRSSVPRQVSNCGALFRNSTSRVAQEAATFGIFFGVFHRIKMLTRNVPNERRSHTHEHTLVKHAPRLSYTCCIAFSAVDSPRRSWKMCGGAFAFASCWRKLSALILRRFCCCPGTTTLREVCGEPPPRAQRAFPPNATGRRNGLRSLRWTWALLFSCCSGREGISR